MSEFRIVTHIKTVGNKVLMVMEKRESIKSDLSNALDSFVLVNEVIN